MSDSVRPHRQQPTRLPCLWDSPGKNAGVGCHFLLQCMKVKSESEVTQSCLTLCNPTDCSPPGSSAHGIFQARVLEWGAIAFSTACVYVSVNVWFRFPTSRSLFQFCRHIFLQSFKLKTCSLHKIKISLVSNYRQLPRKFRHNHIMKCCISIANIEM